MIRTRRHHLGISQEELAGRAGLHRTYLADIERGTRNPTLQSIDKIARALNLSLAALFSAMPAEDTFGATPPLPPALNTVVEIMLVEDNPADAELAVRAFRRAQLSNHVHVAETGEAALDYIFARGVHAHRLPADRPKVVFLDLQLPGISGHEVLRRLKSDARSSNIPVVVLTISQHAADANFCRHLGADAYLVKPLDFQRLCDVAPQLSFSWALCDSSQRLRRSQAAAPVSHA